MTKKLAYHRKTKQISIKYHFIREVEATIKVELEHYKTDEQLAGGDAKREIKLEHYILENN